MPRGLCAHAVADLARRQPLRAALLRQDGALRPPREERGASANASNPGRHTTEQPPFLPLRRKGQGLHNSLAAPRTAAATSGRRALAPTIRGPLQFGRGPRDVGPRLQESRDWRCDGEGDRTAMGDHRGGGWGGGRT